MGKITNCILRFLFAFFWLSCWYSNQFSIYFFFCKKLKKFIELFLKQFFLAFFRFNPIVAREFEESFDLLGNTGRTLFLSVESDFPLVSLFWIKLNLESLKWIVIWEHILWWNVIIFILCFFFLFFFPHPTEILFLVCRFYYFPVVKTRFI